MDVLIAYYTDSLRKWKHTQEANLFNAKQSVLLYESNVYPWLLDFCDLPCAKYQDPVVYQGIILAFNWT